MKLFVGNSSVPGCPIFLFAESGLDLKEIVASALPSLGSLVWGKPTAMAGDPQAAL